MTLSVAPKLYAARAELVLADDDSLPLRSVDLSPDPLAPFTRVMRRLDERESITIALDLLPLRKPARWAARGEHAYDLAAVPTKNKTVGAEIRVKEAQEQAKALQAKLHEPGPIFRVQALVMVTSPSRARAKELMATILSCFAVFDGRNRWRVAGQRIGPFFWGADTFAWRRRHFDRRLATGLFDPSKKVTLNYEELKAFLCPPIKGTRGVLGAGVKAFLEIPDFTGQDDQVPLGRLKDGRKVGMPLSELYFSARFGKTRAGKSEPALVSLVHLARSGHGVTYLDPHHDAIERVLPYLESVKDRLALIDLTRPEGALSWNPFDIAGADADEIERRRQTVISSFIIAGGWNSTKTGRAINFVTQAVATLMELAQELLPSAPPPTIFQIRTLLTDEEWRDLVVPRLSKSLQTFWRTEFPAYKPEDSLPVRNLIMRLRQSRGAVAFLGSPRSSFDWRKALDERLVVLACPGARGDEVTTLLASLMVRGLVDAAYSRVDLPVPERVRHFAFLDEAQTYDGEDIPAALQQVAKFGLVLEIMSQNPKALHEATWEAISTNVSVLMTSALNHEGAKRIVTEWGGGDLEAEFIKELARYHHLATVALGGKRSFPFELEGLYLEGEYGPAPDWQPEIPERSIADLDALDGRIAKALRTTGSTERRTRGHTEGRTRGHTEGRSTELANLYGHARKASASNPEGAPGARALPDEEELRP
jgi:hypothetical protein